MGTALLDAINGLRHWPSGNERVWVACESGIMRQVRAHLISERHAERRDAHARLLEGGHRRPPDHDYGDDA